MNRAWKTEEYDSDFELLQPGTRLALLTHLVFVGHHPTSWQGQERIRDVVRLGYELPDLIGQDGAPLAIFEEITASNNEKAKLYQRVKALNGGREPAEGFELKQLMGRPVLITISHNTKGDRTYANVDMLTPLPANMQAPQPVAPLLYFDIEAPDKVVYSMLPPRSKKLITERIRQAPGSVQAPATPAPPPAAPNPPQPTAQPQGESDGFDDIPF